MSTPTLRLTVTGMTCGHCEKAVTRAIQQVDAAAQVTIDRAANLVQVQTAAAPEAIASAIREEGYAAEQQGCGSGNAGGCCCSQG